MAKKMTEQELLLAARFDPRQQYFFGTCHEAELQGSQTKPPATKKSS